MGIFDKIKKLFKKKEDKKEEELFEKIIKDVSETYPNFSGYYSFQKK